MTLLNVLELLNPIDYHVVEVPGDLRLQEINSASFDHNSLGWCSDKNEQYLYSITKGTVILSNFLNIRLIELQIPISFNRIVVESPRLAFLRVMKSFFVDKVQFGQIHSSVVIHETVVMNSNNCNIGPNVVIENNVFIGDQVEIGPNTVIKSGSIIKDNVTIGSNCTIGGIGFGYELNEDNVYELIPHIGNVVLSENVHIGNNVCIDKAVIGSTIIERDVKIDNLVHIAHGVHIHENSLIIAHAMIAGSVVVGKNSWISPNSAIKQKVTIGENAIVGLGSVVLKNVLKNQTVAGVPAKLITKNTL